jgi:hypothetical protein
MRHSRERQLARLRARLTQRSADLADVGFVLKGSLLQRFKRCSSPGCACHAEPPRLHGPYWQWTNKVDGKTVTRALTEDQAKRYREWMANARRLEEIVRDLYQISDQADAILRVQERAAPPRTQAGLERGAPR